MTTRERAALLAPAMQATGLVGSVSQGSLMEHVRLELGHEDVLDGFIPYGCAFTRAIAPATLLHVVSGNTSHAAIQTVSRGLLLGSDNLVKLPAAGLPAFDGFLKGLPQALREKVSTAPELPDAWFARADAVIAFGSDETLSELRKRTSKPFFGHGHRVSFGIIESDEDGTAAGLAARDASLFDQQGCLSPHLFYVVTGRELEPRAFAGRLATAMQAEQERAPRRAISEREALQIFDLRTNYRFRAANDTRVQIWESPGCDAWTVVFEDDPWFSASPLNRFVFVKPLPKDLSDVLGPVREWIGTAGIWPANLQTAERLADLGISRICTIGSMQSPPLTWHHDGIATLASLVRWIDFDGR